MSYLRTYLGRLAPALMDPGLIEIAINADGRVWVERAGAVHMEQATGIDPLSPTEIHDLAQQIANAAHTRFTETAPLVSAAVPFEDALLRAQVAGHAASAGGPVIGLRVFRHGETRRRDPARFAFLRPQDRSLEDDRRDLVRKLRTDTDRRDVPAFLSALVEHRLNVIISGGTSTGKTELGRALLGLVDPAERIVTIEDSEELLAPQPNRVALIAERDEASPRSADRLLQASLRLRPDRIILGELRGAEAATFLDAINTGHEGSFTTLHAQSARKAMERLALLVLATGTTLGLADILRSLEHAIDVVIQMGREGARRGILETYFPGLEA